MNDDTNNGELLTREQAAEFIGCTYGTLAHWASTGTQVVPFTKLNNNRVMYRKVDLEQWLLGRQMLSADCPRDPRQLIEDVFDIQQIKEMATVDLPQVLAVENREEVARLLRCLRERERLFVELYYGLGGGPRHTLLSIGELAQVTGERVRQVLTRAIRKMQANA